MSIHIHRVPTRIVAAKPHGKERWCFVCRKRTRFTITTHVPNDPMSYYGPHWTVECAWRHIDGDLFPGRFREWDG